MTSTTYSKFKLVLSVFLWTLRNNIAVIVIYLSLIAFGAITDTLFGFSVNSKEAGCFLMFLGTLEYALIIGLVISIRSFSYLHNKRQTDMIGSLPVSRRVMYFSKLISASIISLVPMAIVDCVIILITQNGYAFAEYFPDESQFLSLTLNASIMLIACISFFGLMSICCGKTSDKIISFFGVNLAAPVAITILTALPSMLLMGYSFSFNRDLVMLLSPIFSIVTLNPIYWLIFTAITVIISFFLIKSRKAECAQSHFAYKFPLIAVKVLISFSAGIVAALILLLINNLTKSGNDYVSFWIGMVIGSFIAYMIIQLVFARGFSGFLKGLIPYGAMLLCFAIYFTSMCTGFFGYDNYVPELDEIESVSFNADAPAYFVDGVNILEHNITDKEVIKKAVKAHKDELKYKSSFDKAHMLDRLSLFTDDYDNIYNTFSEDGEPFYRYHITYKLKNGNTVSRVYDNVYANQIDDDGLSNIDFLLSNTYKENISPLFICDKKYLAAVDLYGAEYWSQEDIDNEDFDEDYNVVYKSKAMEVYNTVMEEYKKYGFNTNDLSECSLQFEYGKSYKETELYENFAVPKSYKKTIALIKKYGIQTTSTR